MDQLENDETDGGDIVKQSSKEEMKENSEDSSDIWHLRKEYQVASKALRSRKISCDDAKLPNSNTLSTLLEETTSTNTVVEKSPRHRRPGLVHRKTDPCPMREFVRENWSDEQNNTEQENSEENMEQGRQDSIPENDGICDLEESILQEEPFLISSYDLARRRLSLPISALSAVEHTWNNRDILFDDSDDTDNISLETPVESSVRSSCNKQLENSPNMERRRRQSAWARSQSASLNHEVYKPMSKRRMSELPALSVLATRRRSVPHTVSLPTGLRRKTSRASSSSDYQNLNSSCLKAKNEMLATLTLSTWSENGSVKHSEIGRRKSCHTGFGIMALKKKEEKRLMVAHEILQTEKNYIKALDTLNEVFTEPLKSSSFIPEKDMKAMFPKQLLAMKNGHEKFMNELEERLNNWKWQGVLGDIFTKLGNSYHIDFMTLYSEYVNNFPKSIAVINKYTRNSHKFKRFLEKCGNDPRCERLSISAFLLTPIQRLPRYVLLLRQLAKYTDPNHPDSFHIEISLEKMIHIINILNSSIQNSTRLARNASTRRSSRKRRKRHIFKPRDSGNSECASSPRKSSDDSDLSEASTPSTPHAQDLSPLAIDGTSPTADQKSSGYGSLTNSETPSEPRSPSPSGSFSSKSYFLKVILRNSGESKRRKRRPLSMTEVEINRRKDNSLSPAKDELMRSVSRDSIGSMIRHKFDSLRRRPRSSDEQLDIKSRRPRSPEDDCFVEANECSRSDSDFINDKKLHSCSSMENCTGLREHIPLSRAHSAFARTHSPLSREHSAQSCEHSQLSREHSTQSCEHSPLSREHSAFPPEHSPLSRENSLSREHSDSDDSTTHHDSCEGDVINNNNYKDKVKLRSQEGHNDDENERPWKKLNKRNSFTNAMRYLFISKTRSSSSSPETVLDSSVVTDTPDQLYNSQFSKEKISPMTTV